MIPNYVATTPIPPKFEKIDLSTYNIGKIQEKSVGESMLTVVDGTVQIHEIYKATKTYQPPDFVLKNIASKSPLITEGSTWVLNGTTAGGDKFYKSDSFSHVYCLVSNSLDEFYGITGCSSFYAGLWPSKISGLLRQEKITKYEEGSFKQELVYTGKSRENIRFQYREYRDNFARPAFFQDLSYDLSESKDIGFRGMMIEVLEATNSNIKFIVKSKML